MILSFFETQKELLCFVLFCNLWIINVLDLILICCCLGMLFLHVEKLVLHLSKIRLMEILRECTPLTENDSFMIFSRKKKSFDFPLHTHAEMELNFVMNAEGASRVVGNHYGTIGNIELVLVSGDTPHAWFTDNCGSEDIYEITLQFHANLFDESIMKRNSMAELKQLFEDARRGVLFSPEAAMQVRPLLEALYNKGGAGGMRPLLDMLTILHLLSVSKDRQILSDNYFEDKSTNFHSVRLESVLRYLNDNFNRQLSLSQVASIVNMTEVSFCRFIKKVTGQTFVDMLTDIRLTHVTRMLIDTDMTIAEIAYCCGFNNMANFNRVFKRKKGVPPHKYRMLFLPKKVYV